MTPDEVTLEKALALLSLPRELGPHPEDGEQILAGVGRFGPYVKHGAKYKSIPADESVLEIGMNRAVALLAEAKAAGRGRAAKPIRVVGNHPADEAPIELYDGRYGHYVKHGGINATVPRDLKPEELTLDQAVSLLAERAAKGAGKKPASAKGAEGESQRRGRRRAGQRRRRTTRQRSRRPPRRRPRPSARPPRPRPSRRRAPGPMAKGKVPTRDELLAFIKRQRHAGRQARDRARLGLKGDQRIELKQLLRELRDSGEIAADRAKTFRDPQSTDRHRRTGDRAGRRRRPSARRAAPPRRGAGRPAAPHRDRAARHARRPRPRRRRPRAGLR